MAPIGREAEAPQPPSPAVAAVLHGSDAGPERSEANDCGHSASSARGTSWWGEVRSAGASRVPPPRFAEKWCLPGPGLVGFGSMGSFGFLPEALNAMTDGGRFLPP